MLILLAVPGHTEGVKRSLGLSLILTLACMANLSACDSSSAPQSATPAESESPDRAPPESKDAEIPEDPDNAPAEQPAVAEKESPDAAPQRNPSQRPGIGTRKLGEACDQKERCAENLGCSGLYQEAAGTCIEQAAAKTQCEAAKGEWGQWGMLGMVYCMRIMPDAGKECSASSQCKGRCIRVGDNAKAMCQRYEHQFGCYEVLDGGDKKQTICVD